MTDKTTELAPVTPSDLAMLGLDTTATGLDLLDQLAQATGGQALDLVPAWMWEEPTAEEDAGRPWGKTLAGRIVRVEYVEQVDERKGTVSAPLLVELDTAQGRVAVWCGAVIESIMRRLAGLPKLDKNSRVADECNHATVHERNEARGLVIGLYYYGNGDARPGETAPRLFHSWSFGRHDEWTGVELGKLWSVVAQAAEQAEAKRATKKGAKGAKGKKLDEVF